LAAIGLVYPLVHSATKILWTLRGYSELSSNSENSARPWPDSSKHGGYIAQRINLRGVGVVRAVSNAHGRKIKSVGGFGLSPALSSALFAAINMKTQSQSGAAMGSRAARSVLRSRRARGRKWRRPSSNVFWYKFPHATSLTKKDTRHDHRGGATRTGSEAARHSQSYK
jgi:hypothetical protein